MIAQVAWVQLCKSPAGRPFQAGLQFRILAQVALVHAMVLHSEELSCIFRAEEAGKSLALHRSHVLKASLVWKFP